MKYATRILIATLPLVGCGAPMDPSGDESSSGGGSETSAPTTGSAGDTEATMEPAPDFALLDVNPNSATHDRSVSPRDQLEQVSGWYFAHAT